MKFDIRFFSKGVSGARRVRFAGHPLAVVLLVAVLAWLALSCRACARIAWDSYGSYEGTVVDIRTRWTDHLTSDFGQWEHLLVETPQGRILDKYVSFQRRVMNGIHEGDYVVKEKGFGNAVRRRDGAGPQGVDELDE